MLQQDHRSPVPSYSTSGFSAYKSANFRGHKRFHHGGGFSASLMTGASNDRDVDKDNSGQCFPRRIQTDPGKSQGTQKSDHELVSGRRSMHGQLITGMAPQVTAHVARRDEMVAGSARLPIGRSMSALPTAVYAPATKSLQLTSGNIISKGKAVVNSSSGGSGKQQHMIINMSKYENRLDSFQYPPKWELSLPNIDPCYLSSHGFWYIGQEDIVRCYACSVELCDWEAGMDVFARHFNVSPNCFHLRQHHQQCIVDLCKSQFISYRNLSARLDSFRFAHWPLKGIVSPEDLARAGFFYLGKGAKVQCFSCGCVNEKWEAGVSVLAVHQKLYSKCPLLQEMLKSSPSYALTPPTSPRCKQPPADKPALAPNYSSFEARVQSFKHYPTNSVIEKDDFAEAGFYLLRLPITVRCFACGLTESSWHPGDNPQKRHAQKSQDCPFLKGSVSLTSSASPDSHPSALPEPAFSLEQLARWFKSSSISDEPQADQENQSYLYPSSLVDSLREDLSKGPSSMSECSSTSEKSETSDARRRASVHGCPQPQKTDPASSDHEEELNILNKPVCYPPSYHRQKKQKGPETSNKQTTYKTPPSQTYSTSTATSIDSVGNTDPEDMFCIICFDHPKEYALLPCGHMCSCRYCVSKLDICPICREPVDGKARIFLT